MLSLSQPIYGSPLRAHVGGDIAGQGNTLLLLPSHHISSVPSQLFSSSSESFRSVGSSLLLLLALLRGSASLWPCLPEASGLYCLFCTTYIVLEVWIVLRLLAVVLIHSYREMHSELYRPAFEPQDYEMVELFVRRLKMWMGFSKAKEVRAAWGLCGEGAWWHRAASTIFSLSLPLAPSCSQVPLAGEAWSSGHPWGGPRAGLVMGNHTSISCPLSGPRFHGALSGIQPQPMACHIRNGCEQPWSCLECSHFPAPALTLPLLPSSLPVPAQGEVRGDGAAALPRLQRLQVLPGPHSQRCLRQLQGLHVLQPAGRAEPRAEHPRQPGSGR